MQPTALFIKVLELVSDGAYSVKPSTTLGELFEAGMSPLDFETCLYAVEASTKRELLNEWSEGSVSDHFEKSIEAFLLEFLSPKLIQNPLFVAEAMLKLRQSTLWSMESDGSSEN